MIYIGFEDDKKTKKMQEYIEKLKSKKERWKRIYVDDEKTEYYVSNLGRIYNRKLGIFVGENSTSTYIRITIKGKRFSVHRLVAYYFCKIPKRYLEKGLTYSDLVPNHKNGIKHCNAAFNLEWITQKENTDHAWREGLCDSIRGENNHLAKIDEKTAKKIIAMIMNRKNNKEISETLGVTKKTVQHIRSKECWKHLTKDIEFLKLAEDLKNTITDDQVREVCKLLETFKYSDPEISRMTGINRRYICSIRHRQLRTNISKDYKF